MDMEKKLFELASGENRLNPDEQRYFLGTFRERVVLTASLEDANSQLLQEAFPQILQKIRQKYSPISLKVSAKLQDSAEIHYLKIASDHHIPATMVNEEGASSPFGFLLHTNQAESIEFTNVRQLFPEYFEEKEQNTPKKTFWQKLFGG